MVKTAIVTFVTGIIYTFSPAAEGAYFTGSAGNCRQACTQAAGAKVVTQIVESARFNFAGYRSDTYCTLMNNGMQCFCTYARAGQTGMKIREGAHVDFVIAQKNSRKCGYDWKGRKLPQAREIRR